MSHTSEGYPGSFYRYNGSRFALLSQVIQQASGRSFAELLIERILEPLDMMNTAPSLMTNWSGRDFTHVLRELARPYRFDPTYGIVAGYYPMSFSASAGLITVVDLVKFDIAIDQNLLVRQQTKDQMFTPTVSTAGTELPYGLGWFTQRYKDTRSNLNTERSYQTLTGKRMRVT